MDKNFQRSFVIRSVLINLLFILYLLLLQPRVLAYLAVSEAAGQFNLWLAAAYVVTQILELVAFFLKRPLLMYSAVQNPRPGSPVTILFILMPILHLAGAAILFLLAADVAGFAPPPGETRLWPQMEFVGLFFVVLIKDLLYIGWWLSPRGDPKFPASTPPESFTPGLFWRDTVGEVFYLVYSALTFTLMWDFLVMLSPLDRWGTLWDRAMELLGLSLIFMLVYFPIRSLDYFYLLHTDQPRWQRALAWVFFILILFSAYWGALG